MGCRICARARCYRRSMAPCARASSAPMCSASYSGCTSPTTRAPIQVAKRLVEPDVVPPRHGHQIAEPLVRELVRVHGDGRAPLPLGRLVVQQQQRVAEGDGAGVLHRAGREIRHGDQIELVVRVGDAEVALEALQQARRLAAARTPAPGRAPAPRCPAAAAACGRAAFGATAAASTTSRGPDGKCDQIGGQLLGARERDLLHALVERHLDG